MPTVRVPPVRFSPAVLLLVPTVAFAEPFEFKPTDRVVLIGSTLIEREQRYGYWEAMLTQRYPGITFRNLGWSGDDVYGTARKAFDLDKPDIGRKRLVELALAEKPTVILICYGANEAFEGEGGLDKFRKGYEKLLDELTPAKARIILMSPPPLEKKPAPLPDPGPQNKLLAVYRDAVKQIASARDLYFADLFAVMGEGNAPARDATDNGVHFTAQGYNSATAAFAAALGLPAAETSAPEPLRAAIQTKNELYFHRWRPQNETYLFGFRKHEQGKNAKEIVEFDPLIAAAEADILKLLKKN
jgi:lysophospholipase L1-like esterase